MSALRWTSLPPLLEIVELDPSGQNVSSSLQNCHALSRSIIRMDKETLRAHIETIKLRVGIDFRREEEQLTILLQVMNGKDCMGILGTGLLTWKAEFDGLQKWK